MLILAVETSGKNGGVALARGDAKQFELLGEAPIGGGQYSAELMPRIVELLGRAGISKHEIEAFAVASGPGSFTGLRVGIATVKALADTLQKPVVAVSVLEAVALTATEAQRRLAVNDADARERTVVQEHIVALLDAGRGEVYVGIYRAGLNAPNATRQARTMLREIIIPLGALPDAIAEFASEPPTIATPEEKIFEMLREKNISVIAVERPGAAAIARLGLAKLVRGDIAAVADFDANYIRRSDAELFSLPKLQGK
jgi:tRNA threonylcarbamoyladenosine biosynthesis protein TsaB